MTTDPASRSSARWPVGALALALATPAVAMPSELGHPLSNRSTQPRPRPVRQPPPWRHRVGLCRGQRSPGRSRQGGRSGDRGLQLGPGSLSRTPPRRRRKASAGRPGRPLRRQPARRSSVRMPRRCISRKAAWTRWARISRSVALSSLRIVRRRSGDRRHSPAGPRPSLSHGQHRRGGSPSRRRRAPTA